jgi:hypothetical protein
MVGACSRNKASIPAASRGALSLMDSSGEGNATKCGLEDARDMNNMVKAGQRYTGVCVISTLRGRAGCAHTRHYEAGAHRNVTDDRLEK